MQKYLIIIFWLFSTSFFIYIDNYYQGDYNTENYSNSEIKSLPNFQNFYEIKLGKSIIPGNHLGYKEESFQKNNNGYEYKINFNVSLKDINFLQTPIFNIQGIINFDTNGTLNNLNLLIGDKYYISGYKDEMDNPNNTSFMLTYTNLLDKSINTKTTSKIIDLKDLNIDFLYTKLLPYKKLIIGKKYKFKTLGNGYLGEYKNLEPKEIEIEKIDQYQYLISQDSLLGKIVINLTYGEDNILKEEKYYLSNNLFDIKRKGSIDYLLSFNLINNPNLISSIRQKYQVNNNIPKHNSIPISNNPNQNSNNKNNKLDPLGLPIINNKTEEMDINEALPKLQGLQNLVKNIIKTNNLNKCNIFQNARN